MRLVVDLETDGLLQTVTKIHCAILQDIDSSYSELFIFTTASRTIDFLDKISKTNDLIFHNGFGFDLLVLDKIFNWKPSSDQKVHDTYILSQLLYADMWLSDEMHSVGDGNAGFPGKLFSKRDYGSHGLKAWGQRVKCYKGEYTGGWEQYNDEMGKYCIQDGMTTKTLFLFLQKRIPESLVTQDAIELEYSIAPILARQQQYGVLFDSKKAELLVTDLTAKGIELKWKLQELFPPRMVDVGIFVPKRDDKTRGYVKGVPIMKQKMEEFNPGSRLQIVSRLKEKWGWNPEEFTEKGNARMDEEIIDNLPFKELSPLKEYLTIQKRISQIDSGRQGWTKKVDPDSRIRGSIRQNGAVTGRMAHFCVPMDTRALTRSGWKTYEDLIVGEEILAYDQETRTKKWTPLIDKNKFENAEVGRLYCGRRNFRCTANHKWVVKNKDYYLRSKSAPKPRCPGNYVLKEAKDIRGTHAVVMNAPYDNTNTGGEFKLVNQKYGYNYFTEITHMNKSELESFLNGFLLADGCHRKSTNGLKHSWTFAQAEGEIYDLLLTVAYLVSDKRIGANIKNIPTKTQRQGHNVTITQTSTVRNRNNMRWEMESIETVWCPQTKYGTWVMRQGEEISITGNSPNMAQIPSSDSLYGKECRELFTVTKGKIMIGCDADALEMRNLAGYLVKLDSGRFKQSLLTGTKEDKTDPHSINMYAMGLDHLEIGRDAAKTVYYAYIYGARNAKVGKILMEYGVKFEDYVEDFDKNFKGLLKWAKGKNSEKSELYWKCWLAGKTCLEKFGDKIPELPKLKEKIHELVLKNGYIKGLDGRKLFCRSEHGELNTLLQSAGAVIMKKALYICDQDLQKEGLVPGKDYEFILNVHDEFQLEARNEEKLIDTIKTIMENSINKAGSYFNFPCEMKGTSKHGLDWSETH